ncbi:hypothetical protein HHX47_DHR2000753, partial [Lentinula edodes]
SLTTTISCHFGDLGPPFICTGLASDSRTCHSSDSFNIISSCLLCID